MINKILKTLNGHGSEAESLNAALVQLVDRDQPEARAAVAVAQQKRHQGLLDDASDADLDKLERQLDRAMVRLEKLNLAEPPLRERLADAQTVARRRRWNALYNAYLVAVAEFVASARTTAEKHSTVIACVNHAQMQGFSGLVASMMPETPNTNGNPVCAPDLLNEFERAISPTSQVRSQHPESRPTGIQRKAQKPAPRSDFPFHPPEFQATNPFRVKSLTPAAKKPRTPDDHSPLEPGFVRVTVLRDGYEGPDEKQCQIGQIVKLPEQIAMIAIRNNAVSACAMNIDRADVQGGNWQRIDHKGASTP